jgi:hypothetical protein
MGVGAIVYDKVDWEDKVKGLEMKLKNGTFVDFLHDYCYYFFWGK